MKSWVKKYQSWNWETRLLVAFGAIALIPAFVSLWPSGTPAHSQVESIDTHIPKGFVLIPIDVHNFEALDSMFGRFGLVDLFIPAESGAPQRLVAVNVRLIRAPQNPSRFAVLVPEGEAPQILNHGGSYVVAIKPPGKGGMEFVKPKTQLKRKIIYGGV